MFARTRSQLQSIDFDHAMMVALSPLEEDIADLNRAQLWRGFDSSGLKMVPPYAKSTRKYKKKRGQPVNRVTLKDRSDFYNSIRANASPQGLMIGSDRMVKGFDLAGFLDARYGHGDSIYGVTPKSREKLLKQSIPTFAGDIRKQLR